MKATIKGFEINVSVGIKADEMTLDRHEDRKHNDDGTRILNDAESVKNLDIEVSCGLRIEAMDGEIDLNEIGELVHNSISKEVAKQVREQMGNKEEIPSEPEIEDGSDVDDWVE
jgi:hypothetical protein